MNWVNVKDRLPLNNTLCLIYAAQDDACMGPIIWKREQDDEARGGIWLDLFATSEAGVGFSPIDKPGGIITHWAEWTPPADAKEARNIAREVGAATTVEPVKGDE